MFSNKITGDLVIVGDIHGEANHASVLLRYLLKEYDNRQFVFLGDFIDRGPDTAKVIELLIEFHKYHKSSTFLCGNHDLNLIKALDLVPNPHTNYYRNRVPSRNTAVLYSYGARNADDLNRKMPESHKEFLRNLIWGVEHPDYLFVHCGLDPVESYEAQVNELNKRDMTIFKPKWLHDNSLAFESPKNTHKTIVSGHTILPEVYVGNKRIIVDTGCGYKNGYLSAVTLPEMQVIRTKVKV